MAEDGQTAGGKLPPQPRHRFRRPVFFDQKMDQTLNPRIMPDQQNRGQIVRQGGQTAEQAPRRGFINTWLKMDGKRRAKPARQRL